MRALRAAGLAALLVAAGPHGPVLRAQEPLPQFEVASVKPSDAPPMSGFSWSVNPARVAMTNLTLRQIISHAYGFGMSISTADVTKYRLVGGSEALLEQRYNITTRTPEGTRPEQVPLMLRALLAERFKMKTHEETRQLPVYALTVRRPGQLGPRLRPFMHDCSRPFPGGPAATPAEVRAVCQGSPPSPNAEGFITALTLSGGGPMSLLVARMQTAVDRLVVDETGLSGNYAWSAQYAFQPQGNAEYPGIYTALEEQLGLKLESRTAAIPVVVIDHIEAPTPD